MTDTSIVSQHSGNAQPPGVRRKEDGGEMKERVEGGVELGGWVGGWVGARGVRVCARFMRSSSLPPLQCWQGARRVFTDQRDGGGLGRVWRTYAAFLIGNMSMKYYTLKCVV